MREWIRSEVRAAGELWRSIFPWNLYGILLVVTLGSWVTWYWNVEVAARAEEARCMRGKCPVGMTPHRLRQGYSEEARCLCVPGARPEYVE